MMEPKFAMEAATTASDEDITDVMRKVEVIRRRMATAGADEEERRRRRRRAEADALIARLGEDKVGKTTVLLEYCDTFGIRQYGLKSQCNQ